MKLKYLIITLCAVTICGCVSLRAPYSMDQLSDADIKYLQKSNLTLYGQWLSETDLQIILIVSISDTEILPRDSLKAEVSDDLIKLFYMADNNPIIGDVPVTLCGTETKLIFVLHNLKRKSYKVQILAKLYGNSYVEDPVPLVIRD